MLDVDWRVVLGGLTLGFGVITYLVGVIVAQFKNQRKADKEYAINLAAQTRRDTTTDAQLEQLLVATQSNTSNIASLERLAHQHEIRLEQHEGRISHLEKRSA